MYKLKLQTCIINADNKIIGYRVLINTRKTTEYMTEKEIVQFLHSEGTSDEILIYNGKRKNSMFTAINGFDLSNLPVETLSNVDVITDELSDILATISQKINCDSLDSENKLTCVNGFEVVANVTVERPAYTLGLKDRDVYEILNLILAKQYANLSTKKLKIVDKLFVQEVTKENVRLAATKIITT